MSVNIRSTAEISGDIGIKMLVYGGSGAGKTFMCSTAPAPFIVSAESGLLTLRKFDIPAAEIRSMADLQEVYEYLLTDEARKLYSTICLDSISEIAETVLVAAKAAAKDPRQAYGELLTVCLAWLRAFRDIPGYNVYVSAKEQYEKNDVGVFVYSPSLPGAKLGAALPYYFDEVFHLGIGKNAETGESFRYLRTAGDFQYVAKDRSGALDGFEAPHISNIINKIRGF